MDVEPLQMPVVMLIALITLGIGIMALLNKELANGLMLHPYGVARKERLYTLLSAAAIHTSILHLFLNLFLLIVFGAILERNLSLLSSWGHIQFFLFYVIGILGGNMGTTWVHRNDFLYRSTGASPAIFAIIIGCLILNMHETWLTLPAIGAISNSYLAIFIIIATLFTAIFRKKDNIDHYSHLFGTLTGVLLIILFHPGIFSKI